MILLDLVFQCVCVVKNINRQKFDFSEHVQKTNVTSKREQMKYRIGCHEPIKLTGSYCIL